LSERLALIWGSAFFAGSLAQAAAWLTGQSAVVLLLAMGLLTGHAGFGIVHPENLGAGLEPLVGLLVSLVLFDGGLNLRLAGRDLQRSVLQLVLLRLVLGLPAAAVLAHVLAGLPWSLALVYGAIVLATGPTVVTPMMRQLRLAPKLGLLLEAEGLILEPISAVLGLVLLQVTLGDLGGWQEVASRLLLRLGGGVALGGLAGLLLSEALRRLGAVAEPVEGLLLVDVDQRRLLTGIVGSHDLDEPAVTRRPRVGRDDPVGRLLLLAHPHETESYGHDALLPSSGVGWSRRRPTTPGCSRSGPTIGGARSRGAGLT
jgi:NhaP-type Na+/H+ or K+/H+ antiporter